jgi:uncharacterized protein YacL
MTTRTTRAIQTVDEMLQRLAMHSIRFAMVVVGLVLGLDIAYLARGSLELFPTDEQESTVRVVTTVIAAMLIFVEVGLWVLLRTMRRGAGLANGSTR